MGRPVNKKHFGATEGSAGTEGNNFTVNVKIGSNSAVQNGIILSQRSTNKFNVHDDPDGTSGNTGICTLVAKAHSALAADEMSISGQVVGGGGVWVTKIFNRTCVDSNNNRYKWEMVDDSTVNYMSLTAI